MDLKIKNKRALVFGASSGLGYAIAQSLIQEGVKVAISSSNEGRVQKAARELGATLALVGNLQKPGEASKVVNQVIKEWGGIDILVTNTGGPPKGLFMDLKPEQWQEGFQNLWMSAVEAMQSSIPSMIQNKWGRMMLVTSAAAREPIMGLTISNGLRAGLLGLTKNLSQEVAQYGITVNALLPGYTRTERLKELKVPEDKITSQIPARRLGEPEEFAALATFLASEQAAYLTGQMIAVDGGYLHGI